MNGVICTPPSDENGFEQWDAPVSRYWCERCKSRWARLFKVGDELEASLIASSDSASSSMSTKT